MRASGSEVVSRKLHRAFGALAVAAMLGCGWSKPAASPENSDESESSSESSKSGEGKSAAEPDMTPSTTLDNTGTSGATTPPPAAKATIKDDSEKKETPCNGTNISDLVAAISQAACELPENAPLAKQRPSKEVLDVKATTDAKIAPGSTARISVIFTNKGREPLPLDFTIDPDPRFAFELYTPKGSRVDKPAGSEPSLPQEVSDAPVPEPRTARVTLGPKGTATLSLPWQAVRYKWASKERAKGALPGRGYPREPAGPLAKGKYVLRVITPLANTDETGEHELSQARLNIEIAGTPPPPPPPPEAAEVAKKVPTPQAPPTEKSIEEKFLKATGNPAPPPAPPPRKKK